MLFHRSMSKHNIGSKKKGHPEVPAPKGCRNTTDSICVYSTLNKENDVCARPQDTYNIYLVAPIYRIGNVENTAAPTFTAHVSAVGAFCLSIVFSRVSTVKSRIKDEYIHKCNRIRYTGIVPC